MGWFISERKGAAWKQSWTEQTLATMSLPPLPLLAIFGIICVLFSISGYANYKSHMQRTTFYLKLAYYFLPLILILCVLFQYKLAMFVFPNSRIRWSLSRQAKNIPWGLVVLLVVLVAMVSYQSYYHCMWGPNLWGNC